ncbi:MAG: hypothetical protein FJY95_19505 [Candidatus Handelsmanbacteria bacterium]|nr:hypothetical protein [Candidatus Handelsmanbacteria bacterium]
MGNRALWQSIMQYGEFDCMPVIHWTGWPETLERWDSFLKHYKQRWPAHHE